MKITGITPYTRVSSQQRQQVQKQQPLRQQQGDSVSFGLINPENRERTLGIINSDKSGDWRNLAKFMDEPEYLLFDSDDLGGVFATLLKSDNSERNSRFKTIPKVLFEDLEFGENVLALLERYIVAYSRPIITGKEKDWAFEHLSKEVRKKKL